MRDLEFTNKLVSANNRECANKLVSANHGLPARPVGGDVPGSCPRGVV